MSGTKQAAQTRMLRADFPAEILTGSPVVEWKGKQEASVIGHRGLIEYSEKLVRIASSEGTVSLTGEDLTIFRMNRERIVLHGTIRRIEIGEPEC